MASRLTGVAAGKLGGAQTEVVVVHATVNGVVVEPVIATGKAGSAALRGVSLVRSLMERLIVGTRPMPLGGDVGGRTGSLLVEGTVELSADDDFIELEGALGNGTGQVIGLAEAPERFPQRPGSGSPGRRR